MKVATELTLPDILREHRDEIVDALATPSLRTWDEERDFEPAPQAEAIGRVLVEAVHSHLSGAAIGYLFRQNIKKLDRLVLGKASKVSGKTQYDSDLDLLIEINWEQWILASPMNKLALIDHELCHFGREEDDKGRAKWIMYNHDVEEFNDIVRRWGLWKHDVAWFAKICNTVAQPDLFDGDAAETGDE